MEAYLGLAWHKVSARLLNTRNRFAREHPLFVLKSILLHANRIAGDELEFVFHPVSDAFASRITRDATFDIEVVFPKATGNNFSIERVSDPIPRTLAALEEEAAAVLDLSSPELCLEFLTPLAFKPVDPQRRWLLEPEPFFDLLRRRLKTLWPDLPEPDPVPDIRILPYYWEFTAQTHESKSAPVDGDGREQILGMIGPLYLRGNWRPVLPLLLLCSELHPQALRERRAQGRYRLKTHRAFFDRLIVDPSRYAAAYAELSEKSDSAGEFVQVLTDPDQLARELVAELREGGYHPASAQGFTVSKKDEGQRLVTLLRPRDAVVQTVLYRILAPVLDRMFEHASIGFRQGRSVADARKMITAAWREGYSQALRERNGFLGASGRRGQGEPLPGMA